MCSGVLALHPTRLSLLKYYNKVRVGGRVCHKCKSERRGMWFSSLVKFFPVTKETAPFHFVIFSTIVVVSKMLCFFWRNRCF